MNIHHACFASQKVEGCVRYRMRHPEIAVTRLILYYNQATFGFEIGADLHNQCPLQIERDKVKRVGHENAVERRQIKLCSKVMSQEVDVRLRKARLKRQFLFVQCMAVLVDGVDIRCWSNELI